MSLLINRKSEKAKNPSRFGYSTRMAEYGDIDKDFVVVESDIGYSTFSYLFGDKYPERYFNLGIAEIGAMAAGAGIANSGRNVVVSGYGVFLTMRAVEVVRSFICYPNLNVKLLSSHGGITPAIDGTTHQATEDIAYMSTLPNMKVFVPADENSARGIFDLSINTPGPTFTRLMRDAYFDIYTKDDKFVLGGSYTLREGSDISIITYGDLVFQSLEAAEELAKAGIKAEVIDMYSIKPYDREAFLASARKTGKVLVAENHQRRNGLGYELAALCMKENVHCKFDILALEDTFCESGDYFKLLDKYGFSARCIAEKAKTMVK